MGELDRGHRKLADFRARVGLERAYPFSSVLRASQLLRMDAVVRGSGLVETEPLTLGRSQSVLGGSALLDRVHPLANLLARLSGLLARLLERHLGEGAKTDIDAPHRDHCPQNPRAYRIAWRHRARGFDLELQTGHATYGIEPRLAPSANLERAAMLYFFRHSIVVHPTIHPTTKVRFYAISRDAVHRDTLITSWCMRLNRLGFLPVYQRVTSPDWADTLSAIQMRTEAPVSVETIYRAA